MCVFGPLCVCVVPVCSKCTRLCSVVRPGVVHIVPGFPLRNGCGKFNIAGTELLFLLLHTRQVASDISSLCVFPARDRSIHMSLDATKSNVAWCSDGFNRSTEGRTDAELWRREPGEPTHCQSWWYGIGRARQLTLLRQRRVSPAGRGSQLPASICFGASCDTEPCCQV